MDRVDYTKGILERFLAIERLLEKYPSYQEKFTFIQIGAPSRTHIKRYHDLLGEVEAEADRINWRFQRGTWRPIALLKWHHTHQEIQRYYRVADLCLVTSLHDGMNLVAKEFLAARFDEQGVLILSQFTGAARELARCPHRQSLQHRADGGGDTLRAGDAGRGTAGPHAKNAPDDQGKQCLSLGGESDRRALRGKPDARIYARKQRRTTPGGCRRPHRGSVAGGQLDAAKENPAGCGVPPPRDSVSGA